MAKIFDRVTDLIGGTPLVAFDRIAQAHGAKARILAKLECMNPAGSAKDRVIPASVWHRSPLPVAIMSFWSCLRPCPSSAAA